VKISTRDPGNIGEQLDYPPVLIAAFDLELRYTFVNRCYADFFGCRPQDMIGRHPREVLGELAQVHAEPHLEEALAWRATEYDLELANTPHGPRTVHVVGSPEFGASGRAVGWVTAIVDTTASKQAEAQLARLAAIVESSDDAIISKTLEGRITSWNTGAERIFGHEASEMIGQPITRIIPPELHREEEQILARLKRGERIDPFETTRVAKDGRRIDISLTVSPVHNRAGRVIGASKVARDITERKRAEEARRKGEALAAVVDAAPNGMVMFDAEGTIVLANARMEQLFGYRRDELLGQNVEILVPERFRAGLQVKRRGFIPERRPRPVGVGRDLYGRRKDGSEFPVEIGLSPVETPERPSVLASIIDVTERRAAEEGLHEALRLAKHSEEHVRQIVRELSHRTKNLMAVVQTISWQTARKSRDVQDFEERFTLRLEALARSHDLLAKGNWQGVVLEYLVRAQFEPFVDSAEERVAVHGRALRLMPLAAQDLGMALHELATNASKYGALSVPTGKIDIGWVIDRDPRNGARRFHMTWRETGGPRVTPPVSKGFGTMVVTGAVSATFKGDAELDYRPEGLCWELTAPMGHLIEESPAD
jgi:PAS domain S-box-containing protein